MQDDRYPFAPPPLPGDTAKPRRRRRSRGHGNARAAQELTPQAQTGARPAARAAVPTPPPQPSAPTQREGGSRRHRRRGGSTAPAGAERPAVQAAQTPQRAGSGKAAPAPRAAQQPQRAGNAPQAASRRVAPESVRTEDPGLLLIARRAPKQKYANFEEYITAHGGVTAPLPETEE